jgi:hypothetical protein
MTSRRRSCRTWCTPAGTERCHRKVARQVVDVKDHPAQALLEHVMARAGDQPRRAHHVDPRTAMAKYARRHIPFGTRTPGLRSSDAGTYPPILPKDLERPLPRLSISRPGKSRHSTQVAPVKRLRPHRHQVAADRRGVLIIGSDRPSRLPGPTGCTRSNTMAIA